MWDYRNSTSDQDVFRKDVIVEMYNQAGQKVLAYKIYKCWPSEWVVGPDLDSERSGVAIQTLKLENEGWGSAIRASSLGVSTELCKWDCLID